MSANEEFPRVAVLGYSKTRFGLLVSANEDDSCVIRFLSPGSHEDITMSLKEIFFVGKNFFPSSPSRPEPTEKVDWIDERGRRRKGWVWEIEANGKVKLLIDILTFLPPGKSEGEVVPEEIEVQRVFEERWLEEIILGPLFGTGWHGTPSDSKEEEKEEVLPHESRAFEKKANDHKKGGETEKLAERASRGAERLRELMAKVTSTQKGV